MPMPPTPKIVWGDNWENAWIFPGPVDNPRPVSRPVGAIAEADSGVRDWWETRDDEEVQFDVRFVPRDNQITPIGFIVTGYAGGNGVREALRWMQKKPFRLFPNRNVDQYHLCYLLEFPTIDRESGGTHYKIPLRLRDVNGMPFNEW